MKKVETWAKNNPYKQICHIPDDWDEKYFKDKDYYAVNIYVAMYEHKKWEEVFDRENNALKWENSSGIFSANVRGR